MMSMLNTRPKPSSNPTRIAPSDWTSRYSLRANAPPAAAVSRSPGGSGVAPAAVRRSRPRPVAFCGPILPTMPTTEVPSPASLTGPPPPFPPTHWLS